MQEQERTEEKVSYWQIFLEFFKIGLFTFGGGMAMLPVIERVCVDEKKWLDEEELLDCFSLAQAVPGVVAVSSSSYVGRRLHGIGGAVTAAFAVILPSLIVISVLALFLRNIGENPYIAGAFRAIKASVCGLIIASCIKLAGGALKDVFGWIVGAVSFAAVVIFDVSAVFVIIGGAAAGILVYFRKKKLKEKNPCGKGAPK